MTNDDPNFPRNRHAHISDRPPYDPNPGPWPYIALTAFFALAAAAILVTNIA